MIYLDYAATTPVDRKVLATYEKVCLEYVGNCNSLHKLGVQSQQLERYATMRMEKMLKIHDKEIIYTSGSSESNNLAIKGICYKYQNRGKHIITSYLEHSSVLRTVDYLVDLGFEVDYVKIDDEGLIDLEHLRKLMRNDTILVSLAAVDSELGLRQPIEKIATMVKEFPKCYLHVDYTQALGKVKIDMNCCDLASVSGHKIYGLKGIGLLVKNKNLVLEPLIHGGKSTTKYRSGTPALPLIVSMMKAMELLIPLVDKNYEYVTELFNMVVDKLKSYEGIVLNTRENSSSYVINFSLQGIKPETFLHALEEKEIYISTRSACSNTELSDSVYALTKDRDLALNSLRISLSHLTTKEEIEEFLKVFDECFRKLRLK